MPRRKWFTKGPRYRFIYVVIVQNVHKYFDRCHEKATTADSAGLTFNSPLLNVLLHQ